MHMIQEKTETLSRRVVAMAESATLKMSALARELKRQGHDVIPLSLGEPDFNTPEHIRDAAKQALDDGYTRYTPVPGLLELREAIIRKFKRDNGLEFTPNQIVVSNGAKQSIANLSLALLNEGDEVIIFAPYWVSYWEIVKLGGGVPVALRAGIENDFKVSPDQLRAAITPRTRMVLFSSPCNPTGSVYTYEELEGLVKVLADHEQIVIVSDEIYEHINFAGRHVSIASFPAVQERTVTVNGFSKGYAMTGWRLGYIGAPQWIASACQKIQGQFTSGASAFGQKAAAVALDSDHGPTLEMKKAFEARRELIIGLLSEIPGIEVNRPQGAFYIFPNVSAYFGKSNGDTVIHDATDLAMYLLERAHVSSVSGSAFGDDDCLRISYAASDEQIREAVRRIAKALGELE